MVGGRKWVVVGEEKLLPTHRRGENQLPHAVGLEYRIEFRSINFSVYNMAGQRGDVVGFQGVLAPDDYRAAPVVQVVRRLGHELRQQLANAAQFFRRVYFIALAV